MVIDTSIFIEHLRAKNKDNTTLSLLSIETEIFTTSVSVYELLMGATSKEKRLEVEILLIGITVLPFDRFAATKAAEIYNILKKQNQLIEFRDIYIAATSIVNEFPILTLNKKHFARIDGLKLF